MKCMGNVLNMACFTDQKKRNDVKPHAVIMKALFSQVLHGASDDFFLLGTPHGFSGGSVSHRASCPNLNKNDRLFILGNNIDLSKTGSEVAIKDAIATRL